MPVPINTFTLEDINNELGSNYNNIEDLFNSPNIEEYKLHPSYCYGIEDLLSLPYEIKKWRGYGGILCGTSASYTGGQSYPKLANVILGTSTGNVNLISSPQSVPDRFIAYYNNILVIDTGYISTSLNNIYDFGNPSRASFNNSLSGKLDPILGVTYPNLTHFPDDGYPRVIKVFTGHTQTFVKYLNTPTNCLIAVYAPMFGTVWDFSMSCPQ
jgi:hypothetical protein